MAKEDCDKSTAPVSCQAFSWTLLWRFRLTFSYLCLLKYPRLHGLRGHTLHLHHLSSSSLSLLTHGLLLLEPAGTAVLGDPFQPAKEEQADTPAPITFFSLYHGNCLPPPWLLTSGLCTHLQALSKRETVSVVTTGLIVFTGLFYREMMFSEFRNKRD